MIGAGKPSSVGIADDSVSGPGEGVMDGGCVGGEGGFLQAQVWTDFQADSD